MTTARDLLAWYDRHRRDLPWRKNRDPYRVWVSEIMLQQTRVEVVIPYYERFLARFPSIEVLAEADEEELLALWSGLGYYRRGRQMHAAARKIVERGEFPRTVDELRALPGIGEYTSAAIASIAFDVVTPVMDGNVERVMCRLLAVNGDPKKRPVRRRLIAGAHELLVAERPGDSNQALMELGATICPPRKPHCLLCPLAARCEARKLGNPEAFPPPRKRRRVVKESRLVAWVEIDGGVLLFRRPESSELLAGTWELPWVELADGRGSDPAERLKARYGGSWKVGDQLSTVRHGITHRAIQAEVHRCEVEDSGSLAEGPEAGIFSTDQRARLPLSSLVEKVARAVGEG